MLVNAPLTPVNVKLTTDNGWSVWTSPFDPNVAVPAAVNVWPLTPVTNKFEGLKVVVPV